MGIAMDTLRLQSQRFEQALTRRLAPHQAQLHRLSVDLLRLSLGAVFLLFGVLKFVPGLSPAADLATETVQTLAFGLIPDWLGLGLVALLETTIGLSLVTGRYLRLGLLLLGGAMIGILSPLVLFPGELFTGPFFAPTLEGQYVIKDVILLAAALVIAVRELTRRSASQSTPRQWPRHPDPAQAGSRLDLDAA